MNKAILISIRPEHLVNILNGAKTLELRKNAPFPFSQGRWVYLYCTKGGSELVRRFGHYWINNPFYYPNNLNGKVVARFWLDTISLIDNDVLVTIGNKTEWTSEETDTYFLLEKMKLSVWDALEYLKSKDGYAWHIKNLEIFEPFALSELYQWNDNTINCLHPSDHCRLTRAPQSWQYVYIPDGWL